MTNKDLSYLIPTIDRMIEAVDLMNDEVSMWGTIEKDWEELWQPYLHVWNQKDMEYMAEVIFEINKANPSMLDMKKGHQDTLFRILETLDTYETVKASRKSKTLRNVLDTKENKPLYWKFVMSMREIFNNVNGIHLPMAKKRYVSPKLHRMDKTTVFTSKLFTRH